MPDEIDVSHAASAPTDDRSRPRPRVVMLVADDCAHETRVWKQARSLTAAGYEVHVLAVAGGGLPDCEVRAGVTAHRVRSSTAAAWRWPLAWALWWSRAAVARMLPPCAPDAARLSASGDRGSSAVAARSRSGIRRFNPVPLRVLGLNVTFARAARALQPSIVQAHDLNTLPAAVAVRRADGTPVVYDSHELYLERNLAGKPRRIHTLFWSPVERFCIRRCEAVMSVADGICRALADRYGIAQPVLVRNVQPYAAIERSRVLAGELRIPEGTAIVLYPGAIMPNRGLEALIDAAPHLDDAVVVIMGYAQDASYLDGLQQRAKDRGVLDRQVRFREAVAPEQVLEYVASADVGVVPTPNVCRSYFFESSNKLFHCIMAGVPLAVSGFGEKRELVERHGVGVCFDETNPASIARAINDLLADRPRYDEMRRRCREAAKTLNWEAEEAKLRAVFTAVCPADVPSVRGRGEREPVEAAGATRTTGS